MLRCSQVLKYDYGKDGDLHEYFSRYIEHGGFPGITEIRDHQETIRPFLNGIYNTIIMKDLTSAGRKTSSDTIDNYLHMLENAFVLYRARRYDLKGKLHLKTLEKYYLVDTGIRNELARMRGDDYGHTLENIVYFELLRRGYEVSIGKLGPYEVDFVATKPEKTVYYQVTATMLADETRERELRPLRGIPDNYEKTVLSMDRTPYKDFDGIRNVNILDFLLADE